MANQLDHNPWVLDTVMATPYKSYVKIRDIIWTDQVNAGDQLTILDMNGKIVWDTKANAPNDTQKFMSVGYVNGFQLTVIGSGKVLVAV